MSRFNVMPRAIRTLDRLANNPLVALAALAFTIVAIVWTFTQ